MQALISRVTMFEKVYGTANRESLSFEFYTSPFERSQFRSEISNLSDAETA